MAWSKTCKIATFIAISASAITVLIILIHISTRLCENKNELFYKPLSKCYEKLSPTPCQNEDRYLVFVEESPRSQYGECACPHEKAERSMLFYEKTKQCYYIFTQGFCEEGFWVNITREGKPFCERNRCLHLFNETSVPDEVVPLKNGECGILNRKVEGCKENETIQFYSNHILPSCTKPKKLHKSSVGVPASSCPLGSYPSIMGKCQPDFDFDK